MNKGNVEISIQLGKNIAMLRKSARMTQAKLAELIGVETLSISRIERGTVAPSIATIGKIAEVIGVPLSSLFVSPESSADIAFSIADLMQRLPLDYRKFIYSQVKEWCDLLAKVGNSHFSAYSEASSLSLHEKAESYVSHKSGKRFKQKAKVVP